MNFEDLISKLRIQISEKNVKYEDGKTSLSIKKAIDRPEGQTSSYSQRPPRTGRSDNRSKDFRPKGNFKPKESFEDKMARFLKAVKRICLPSNVTLYQNRAEDEHNLLRFLMLHYLDKGKPVIGLPFLM